MTTLLKTVLLGAAALSFAACTTTGNTERGAGYGALAGAALGAGVGAISGDVSVGEGAAIGAAGGAVVGGIQGRNKDAAQGTPTTMSPILDKSTRYYDENTRRYYYFERGTNRTFYENGQRRT